MTRLPKKRGITQDGEDKSLFTIACSPILCLLGEREELLIPLL
jgi:hypothetical protein